MDSKNCSQDNMNSSPAKMISPHAKMNSSPAKMNSSSSKMNSSPDKMNSLSTSMDSSTAKLESSTAKLQSSKAKLESSKAKLESSTAKLESSTAKLESSTAKKNYLEVGGDGSNEAVAISVLKKMKTQTKPNLPKIEKSPLFDKLESFMAAMKKDEEAFETLTEEEKSKLVIEDDGSGDNVVAFNIVAAEDMQDSPVFKILEVQSALSKLTENDDKSDAINKTKKMIEEVNCQDKNSNLEDDDSSLSSSSSSSSSGDLERSLTSLEDAEEDSV